MCAACPLYHPRFVVARALESGAGVGFGRLAFVLQWNAGNRVVAPVVIVVTGVSAVGDEC